MEASTSFLINDTEIANSTNFNTKPATEILYDEVHSTFWVVFIIYVCCSITWIIYCCLSYHRELEAVKKKVHENGVRRRLEFDRMLKAYERIPMLTQPRTASSTPPPEQIEPIEPV
ncbi:unnamed protein product [Caenorhabditis auriculariae]|uniref:Uncharacterized protein n=1 Tax=Caenorhabditis auriculariae TaxID=2777116 RepID=A0A8S1HN02_9PELO|nr:unnamed protein product [Caenorhabditis auriculariae]